MLQTVRLILCSSLIVAFALANHDTAAAQKRKAANQRVATMFDEFGVLKYCDLTARLDNFAITLTNTPKATGYILAYAPPEAGLRNAENVKNYLVNSRGILEEDVVPMYAGRNSVLNELRLQLWVVPDGALPPTPVKYDAKPESFKGMFYEQNGYDEIPYPGPSEEFGEGLSIGVTLEAFTDVLHKTDQRNFGK